MHFRKGQLASSFPIHYDPECKNSRKDCAKGHEVNSSKKTGLRAAVKELKGVQGLKRNPKPYTPTVLLHTIYPYCGSLIFRSLRTNQKSKRNSEPRSPAGHFLNNPSELQS